MDNATVGASLPRLKNRRGVIAVLVAVAAVGLLGMLTITLDIGAGGRQRRIAQTAADAGAIGGGTQIYRKMDSATVVAAAVSSATINGFSPANITVNYPPASGTFAGNTLYVEVLINKNIPTIFGSMFNKASIDVAARGVAGLGSQSQYCVFALAESGNAIDIPGDLTANCGIASNASIYVKKGIEAPLVAAVGSVSGGPANTFTGVPPTPDPYIDLSMPTGADTVCTYTGVYSVNSNATINPGVYCGGISIKKNIKATFKPGTYFIRGGGLSGGEVSATGGVTIINGIGPNGNTAAFKPLTFENSCLFNITAPTSGPYMGVAIFVDPGAPSAVNKFCGNGTITGIVYMPSQTFELVNSNGKLTIVGALIAKVVTGENGGGKFEVSDDTWSSSILKRLSLVQ